VIFVCQLDHVGSVCKGISEDELLAPLRNDSDCAVLGLESYLELLSHVLAETQYEPAGRDKDTTGLMEVDSVTPLVA
jgi:hypothetical protein